MTTAFCIGIDVSKHHLDAGTARRSWKRLANDEQGRRSLIDQIRTAVPTLVVVESTGGYERPIVEALHRASIPVAVVQPSCVRYFARSIKVLAKTDAIDARILARFGEATEPRPTQPTDPAIVALRAKRDRRDQIIEDRVREENRLEACVDPTIRRQLQASIRRLKLAEAKLDAAISAAIKENEDLAARNQVLQSEIGVAQQTATTLLCYLPELGTLNRQKVSALAGLAPYDRSSGQYQGKRTIYGGRARLRTALYMAALTAARSKGELGIFYRKLRTRGKIAKVALIAVARKLLVRLNSLMAAHLAAKHA